LIIGENFTLVEEGELKKFGFATTRWVEADDAKTAESNALEALKADEVLRDIPEDQKDPSAKVYFEEVEELLEKPQQAPGKGFTWFPMDKFKL